MLGLPVSFSFYSCKVSKLQSFLYSVGFAFVNWHSKLYAGAPTLLAGTPTLLEGATTLLEGASTLLAGSPTLLAGASTLLA